jgi:hypothetical protein
MVYPSNMLLNFSPANTYQKKKKTFHQQTQYDDWLDSMMMGWFSLLIGSDLVLVIR